MTRVLEANKISIAFGGLKAVTDVDIHLGQNELLGLIGPNGAGKTTVFNLLTGVYTPDQGDILLAGESVKGLATHKLVEKGIARTFQNIRLFKYMSVLQNVVTAYNGHMSYGYLAGMLRLPAFWKEEKEAEEKAMALLKLFGLDGFAHTYADNLPYGAQRKLEIARALATEPKVLLLDEPAAGMNPRETEELMETIRFIRNHFQIAVLLIEHDMKLVLGVCERVMVLDMGKVIANGLPQDVINDPKVIEAYLGAPQEV